MRVFVSLLALSLLGFALVAGCSFEIPEGRFGCDVDSDCPSPFRCVASRCTRSDAGVDAGPDASAPDAGPDAGPSQDCSSPGDGKIVMILSRLELPEPGEVVGFDLDDHYTIVSGPIGCGNTDLEGGVDNMLPEFLPLFGSGYEVDYVARIQVSATSGSNEVQLELEGYDGPNDAATLVSVFVGGEPLAGAQSICASANSAGEVEIELPFLPYSIPGVGVPTFPLDLREARIRVGNPLESNPVSGVIGGSTVFDDGEGGGIRGYVTEVYDDGPGLPIGLESALQIWELHLDMGPPGECDAISSGFKAEFTIIEAN